jgi:hypothetical protein
MQGNQIQLAFSPECWSMNYFWRWFFHLWSFFLHTILVGFCSIEYQNPWGVSQFIIFLGSQPPKQSKDLEIIVTLFFLPQFQSTIFKWWDLLKRCKKGFKEWFWKWKFEFFFQILWKISLLILWGIPNIVTKNQLNGGKNCMNWEKNDN